MKKGINKIPFGLWYGYAPNMNYFKVFRNKCYIFKDARKGKLDVKCYEGILLGYSTKRKAYKCLNYNTKKIKESEKFKVDEFLEKYKEECKKKT